MWSTITRLVKNWFNKNGTKQFRFTEWCRKKYYKGKGYNSYMINITTGRAIWQYDPSMDAEIDDLNYKHCLKVDHPLKPLPIDYAKEANRILRNNN